MPDESGAGLLLDTLRAVGAEDQASLARRWSRVDARGLADLLALEGASHWLLRRLDQAGLADAAPPALVAELRAAVRQQVATSMLVDAATEDVLRELAGRGVPCVAIKGTARRALAGVYPLADARATVDVDLLLPEASAGPTWEALRARWPLAPAADTTPAGHFHAPPLSGPGGITVELHTSLARTIAPDEAWRRAGEGATSVPWHGMDIRVPGALELLWQAVIHGTTAPWDGFRLRYFLDAVVVLAAGPLPDWEIIARRVHAGEAGEPAVAAAWLCTACAVAGLPVPAPLAGPAVAFDLGRQLRWRLLVLRRFGRGSVRGRLLEEAARAELGRPLASAPDGTAALARARRHLAGRAARIIYGLWRVGARRRSG